MAWLWRFWVCLFLFACNMGGQDLGSPLITNYEPEQTGGHTQNWLAAQDKRGVMFFANTAGILEFDGQRWKYIPTPSQVTVRSILCAQDGTLYFGSIGDFGFLAAGKKGETTAISLKDKIPKADRAFNDIWQILDSAEGTVFFSRERIFRKFKDQIHSISGGLAPGQGCRLNGHIFFPELKQGLSTLQGNEVVPLPFAKDVDNGYTTCCAPMGTHKLLVARSKGGFVTYDLSAFWDDARQTYDFKRPVPKDIVQPFPCDFADGMTAEHHFMYKLHALPQRQFAICTLKSGILLFDDKGKAIRRINTHDGLLDNTVADLFVDGFGNLWVTNNSGISFVDMSTPHRFFGASHGLRGNAMNVIQHKGTLYVGTFQDIQALNPYDPVKDTHPTFKSLKNAPTEVWQFLETPQGDLLATTSAGLTQIAGDQARNIDTAAVNAYCMGQSPRFPDHLFVGLMDGLFVFKRSGAKWTGGTRYSAITDTLRSLATDRHGDLWASTEVNGLLRIQFKGEDPTQVSLQTIGTQHGLPCLENIHIKGNHGNLYVYTPVGIFTLAAPTNRNAPIRFVLENTFGAMYAKKPMGVKNLIFEEDGTVWQDTEWGIRHSIRQPDGSYLQEEIPFRNLPGLDLGLYLDDSKSLWLPGKRLFRVDTKASKDYSLPFQTLIRRVSSGDTSFFEGTFAKPSPDSGEHTCVFVADQVTPAPRLPFHQNALRFDFAASFYEKPGTTEFQYLLEGFEKGWSPWSLETRKDYTNLPPGKFRFHVRARNLYGTLGQEAVYGFQILPPWYRTWWAYSLWTLLGLGMVYGVILLYTAKLRRQKIVLEALVDKRTQELREASLTDPLTGLRNRRFLTEVLNADIAAFVGYKLHLQNANTSNRRSDTQPDSVFGIFMMDIDFFKHVNDTHGHDSGDRVLKQFSDILKQSARQDDAILRLGGEEFLVVLKKTRPDYLAVFAAKIMEKVRSHVFILNEGLTLQKTCSLGYTAFPLYSEHPGLLSMEQSLQLADLALYHAKKSGRNRAILVEAGEAHPGSEEEIRRMVTDLDFALERGFARLIETESRQGSR